MSWLNSVFGAILEAVLSPVQSLPPIAGLGAVSLAVAAATLLMFRATADLAAMAAARRQMHAGLFEIRLFNDDLVAMFRALGNILRHNLTYVRLSLPAMLWLLVPLALLVAQLQSYYGYEGLEVGTPALVKVALREDAPSTLPPSIALEAPSGLQVDTARVWIPSLREAAWRISPQREGEYQLIVTIDGRAVSKSVHVSGRLGRRSPERLAPGLVNQALFPAEPPIDADVPIESIRVTYPPRQVSLLGWHTHWTVAFLVLSTVFAFALRRPLKAVI